jgi:hypothetical protein
MPERLPPDITRWLDEVDNVERKVGWPEVWVQNNRARNLEAWRETGAGRAWALRCALADLRDSVAGALGLRRLIDRLSTSSIFRKNRK